jgi:hypothetical protein
MNHEVKWSFSPLVRPEAFSCTQSVRSLVNLAMWLPTSMSRLLPPRVRVDGNSAAQR